MGKYYAVKNGYRMGIFDSWDDCRAAVEGFSGAEYKSFKTIEDAEVYLGLRKNDALPSINSAASPDKAAAYVDGSFDPATGRFSYGAVIFHNGKEITMNEAFSDKALASMHNVAGEIMGAMAAMRYCLENGITALELYYDYEGIKKWCTGEWSATKPGTIEYSNFYLKISKRLKVTFNKVKGHSGDRYNDMADSLAKAALGL